MVKAFLRFGFTGWLGVGLCLSCGAQSQPAADNPGTTPDPTVPQELALPEDIPPPPSPPDPLVLPRDASSGQIQVNLKEAVEKAWQALPEVLAADARVRRAYWAMQQADSLPSASLGVGTWQGGVGAALLNSNYISEPRADYYLWLVQPFRPLGSLSTSRQVAYRELTQAQSQATSVRIQAAQRCKDAFYRLMAAEQHLQVAQRNLDLAEAVLEISKVRFAKGAGPRLDEINATIQRNRSRQDLTLARGEHSQAQARLAPLLALSAHTPIQTSGQLEPPPGGFLYETLLDLARQHPRLQAAREAVEQSSASRKLAEQQNNPTPGLSATYDMVRPSYVVQLTLSIPIDWGIIRNDVRQKIEVEREKEQLLYQEQLTLASELKASFEAYKAAYENASAYLEEVLKPSEESAQITEYGYRRGAISYLQQLTTQQQLSSVRQDYIERQLAVHLALNALEAAVGRQLEGVQP